MKRYVVPEIEVTLFISENVLTESSAAVTEWGQTNGVQDVVTWQGESGSKLQGVSGILGFDF